MPKSGGGTLACSKANFHVSRRAHATKKAFDHTPTHIIATQARAYLAHVGLDQPLVLDAGDLEPPHGVGGNAGSEFGGDVRSLPREDLDEPLVLMPHRRDGPERVGDLLRVEGACNRLGPLADQLDHHAVARRHERRVRVEAHRRQRPERVGQVLRSELGCHRRHALAHRLRAWSDMSVPSVFVCTHQGSVGLFRTGHSSVPRSSRDKCLA
eukprot:3631164-Rhodomonas_salina.3